MKFLTKKQVKDLVSWSFAHTARLEAEGKFPQRVRLGQGRVVYVEQEIHDYMNALVAVRDGGTGS
jgi:prophage regulatory protein